jgi:hypothetical protein
MQTQTPRYSIAPDVRTIIAAEARKFVNQMSTAWVLVPLLMLLMVVGALTLGAWWDRLSTGL